MSLSRSLAISLMLLLCTACAAARSAAVAQATVAPTPEPWVIPTQVPSPKPTATPRPGAPAEWRFSLPVAWTSSHAVVAGDRVVIAGRPEVFVLDAKSGRLLWRHDDGASALVADDDTVYYGTSNGSLVARSLRSGALRWRDDAICPIEQHDLGVDVAIRSAADLVVGCNGGRILRIAAASGSVLAHDDYFGVWQVSAIAPIGSCAYSITGWNDGAAIVNYVEILGCKRLDEIVPRQTETWLVGTIGDQAILDDECCFGRPDVYEPATIFRANLKTGALSPKVDLTPEPDRYPANHRPIGQGSVAFLSGGELYLSVDQTLYRYGDPRMLSSPKRLPVALLYPLTVVRDGLVAMRLQQTGDAAIDELVRMSGDTPVALWGERETGNTIFGYDPAYLPSVLSVGDGYVNLDTDREMRITDPCQTIASDRTILVSLCTSKTLVGNRNPQFVAAYPWPN